MSARPAAIYCRLSRNRSGELSASVQRQEADGRAVAERRGLEVGRVYVDDDVSAYSSRRRPAFEAMMADLEAGLYGAIVVYHVDRLYRRVSDLERIIGLVEAAGGVPIYTAEAGDFDLATADGRLHARISGVVARHSSERAAERIRRAKDASAAAGRNAGGIRAIGYTADGLALEPGEASRIRRAADDILAGKSMTSTERDCGFTRRTLRRILLSPRTAGLRVHRGQVVGAGAWPPIITPAEQLRLRAILQAPGRERGPGMWRHKHPLSGLVVCDACDERMGTSYPTRASGSHPRSYACRQCHRSVVAEALEDFVRDAVLLVADSADLTLPAPTVDLEALEASLAEDEAAIADLGARMGRRELPAAFALAAVSEIEARIASTRAQIAAVGPAPVEVADLRADWEGMAVDERRAALAGYVAAVRVLSGDRSMPRRFDGRRRVRIAWRDGVVAATGA